MGPDRDIAEQEMAGGEVLDTGEEIASRAWMRVFDRPSVGRGVVAAGIHRAERDSIGRARSSGRYGSGRAAKTSPAQGCLPGGLVVRQCRFAVGSSLRSE